MSQGAGDGAEAPWLAGAVLRITTRADELIDGQVLSFDPLTRALVLRASPQSRIDALKSHSRRRRELRRAPKRDTGPAGAQSMSGTGGFQTQIYNQPAVAVAGDFASQNPFFTLDAGPGGGGGWT